MSHRRITLIKGMLTVIAAFTSPWGHAWGGMQHEIAAELGQTYLTNTAKARIAAILGQESLADASTWADRMRSNPARFWQKEAGPYHYVTVPPGQRYAEVGPPPQGDAMTALTRFRAELLDPDTPLARQQLALRFAIHIVQDLHQPLHVGNGRDRGGNQISVKVNGKDSNLHRLWDREIFESTSRSKEQWLNHLFGADLLRAPGPGDADPLLWIAESAALRETLYPVKRIDAAYYRRELPRAEQRLVLAGIRMAAWLNATFAAAENASDVPPPLEGAQKRRWWQRLLGG